MKMRTIRSIRAREILDSRGNPTLKTKVLLESGIVGEASVPSGVSTGKHEALELRDGDYGRFLGKGVLKAVFNVNEILAREIVGMDVTLQDEIDKRLIEIDGTPNKERLGANALLSVSLAVADAASKAVKLPLYCYLGKKEEFKLPVPLINILNGGSHADNNVDIQEFMIVPSGRPSFSEAIRAGAEVFYCLRKALRKRGYSSAVGDEGGFAPNLSSNEEALELLLESIKEAGYEPGVDLFLALDVAASELHHDDEYFFHKSDGSKKTAEEMCLYYASLIKKYPIISIEDGLAEDDWQGWKRWTEMMGSQIQIVGDDIFVTNRMRFEKGVREGIANSILIKPNQIGTLTETIETVRLAQEAGYSTIISHRSGETEDTFIADLSVGLNSGQIKAGSLSRSERVAKYNRLMEIEDELQEKGHYAGKEVYSKFSQFHGCSK